MAANNQDVGFDVPMEMSVVIRNGVLLGSRPRSLKDLMTLRALGVKTIVNVCEEDDAALLGGSSWFALQMSYRWFPVFDDGQDKELDWWKCGIEAIAHRVGVVAVHCVNGVERSASLVYGYLRVSGFSRLQAKSIIDIARPIDLIGIRYAMNFERLFNAAGGVL